MHQGKISHSKHPVYGEQFDKPIAFAMALLIVLALVGVIALQLSARRDCTAAKYTYCDGTTY